MVYIYTYIYKSLGFQNSRDEAASYCFQRFFSVHLQLLPASNDGALNFVGDGNPELNMMQKALKV